MVGLLQVLVSLALSEATNSTLTSASSDRSIKVQLDPLGKVKLDYVIAPNKQSITYTLTVRHQSWVAFGISPTGSMKGSIVAIGTEL